MAKARNKYEETALRLSQSLPYMGYAVTEWAINYKGKDTRIEKETRLVKKGVAFCPFCAKEFKTDKQVGQSAECPHCHKKLKVIEGKAHKYNKYMLVKTSREYKGWKVEDYGQVHIETGIGGKICREMHPMFQWWTDKDGHKVCIGSVVNGFKAWSDDCWSWTDFEVRRPVARYGYYGDRTYYDTNGFFECPIKRSNHPLDKMVNKFSKERGRNRTIWEMRYCNGDILETLSKINLPRILDYYFRGYSTNINHYWKTLLIARRNGYNIEEDFTMYIDYLRALEHLGKDLKNPHYICPKNLRESHDWAIHKSSIKYREEERMREERRAILEEKRAIKAHERAMEMARQQEEENKRFYNAYTRNLGNLIDLVLSDDKLTIEPLHSVSEVAEEGKAMHHCVFAMGYWKKPENLLMSAKDKQGNRVETIQIDLRTYDIVQSRGIQNSKTEMHDDIINLLTENMNLIKKIRNKDIKNRARN